MSPAKQPLGTGTEAARALLEAERLWGLGEAVVQWEDNAKVSRLEHACSLYERAARLASIAAESPPDPDVFNAAPRPPGDSRALDAADPSFGPGVSMRELRMRVLRRRHQAIDRIAVAHAGSGIGSSPVVTRRRLRWVAGLALVASVLVGGALTGVEEVGDWLRIGDVGNGRRWTASSAYQAYPDRGRLGLFSAPFFFHTDLESSPSLEIDLGRDVALRRAVVSNRLDCCRERALPLVLEISRDHLAWKPLAERRRPFQRWRVQLSSQRARWVRLRVNRRSMLHLQAVLLRS
jgi:hypothetical protein